MRKLDSHFFLFEYELSLQAFFVLYPIFLFSGLCKRTLILLSNSESPLVSFSIGNLFLPDIVLRSPSLFYRICFCCLLENILLSFPIVCPLYHLCISYFYYIIFCLCGQVLSSLLFVIERFASTTANADLLFPLLSGSNTKSGISA